jgi:membrane protease YdiL (CAAX protease family)
MTDIDKKRLTIFLILAFSIAWLCALVIFLNGGLTNSPEIVPGTGITLALVLLATIYMWGPALAHILTRLITKEGWQETYLKPVLKQGWRYWLLGWFGPGILSISGAILYFIYFPNHFDPQLTTLKTQLAAAGLQADLVNPFIYVAAQAGVALLLAPALNFGATFGEEFGWRAYLLPKLKYLGSRKALLISGVIWGIWHWPVIWMGHNYGLDYWGYPWAGLLATVWFCVSIGIFFGWLSQKAGSVWPAVFAHGALNGIAGIGLLFVQGSASPLLGPSPAGIIGCLPFTLVSVIILLNARE